MLLSDTLPTDSVLRRHAIAERNRILGLPPSDSVLRRHHAQWEAAEAARTNAPPATAPVITRAAAPAAVRAAVAPAPAAAPTRVVPPVAVAAPVAPRAPAVSTPTPMPTPSARPAGGGGLFGWLRRLLGAN